MTNDEIVAKLEAVLRRKIFFAGAELVLASEVRNLLEELKTKGSE